MKKLLLTAAAILATLNMYGQGQGVVTLSTFGLTDPNTMIWVNDTGEVGTGARATSTGGYNIALYWAPANTTDDRAFQRIGNAGNFSGAQPGNFNLFGRTITYDATVAAGPGALLAFQVRAWTTANGTDYDLVVASGAGRAGKGPIIHVDTKDPNNSLETAPNIWETRSGVANPLYRGFALTPVPEPSVIGLGLLGAGALLMLRRRK